MAKFIVFFKSKPIQSFVFESGVIYIGRDSTNSIVIDNLSIAPIHAIAVVRESDCLIKQINENFPLLINNEPHKEYCLTDRDKITLGKYDILYSPSSYANDLTLTLDTPQHSAAPIYPEKQEANLQILDGKFIGRIVPVKKEITRLGFNHNGLVIITKKNEGYFISALEGLTQLAVNGQVAHDQIIKLSHNDIIRIDNTTLQFFLG